MKWILVLMVFVNSSHYTSPDSVSVVVSPHSFTSEKQCKAFVQKLREEHQSKRIDASCIAMFDREAPHIASDRP